MAAYRGSRINIGQVTVDPHISPVSDKISMNRRMSSLLEVLHHICTYSMDCHETSFTFLGSSHQSTFVFVPSLIENSSTASG